MIPVLDREATLQELAMQQGARACVHEVLSLLRGLATNFAACCINFKQWRFDCCGQCAPSPVG
jgi:hypothetical protein